MAVYNISVTLRVKRLYSSESMENVLGSFGKEICGRRNPVPKTKAALKLFGPVTRLSEYRSRSDHLRSGGVDKFALKGRVINIKVEYHVNFHHAIS